MEPQSARKTWIQLARQNLTLLSSDVAVTEQDAGFYDSGLQH